METERKKIENEGATTGSGGVDIPEEAMEMVRSVREVVLDNNCTDTDIYAALIDSDMDLDDAVHALLFAQPDVHEDDTFHEVKSKRQRRKERKEKKEKETLEPRASDINSGYRGLRVSGERNLGSLRSQSSSSYNDAGKAAYGRGSGSVSPLLPSSSHKAKSPKWVQELEEDAASNSNVNIDGVASLSTESAFHMDMPERHEGIEKSSHSLAANDYALSGRVSAATANLKQLSLGEKPMVHSSAYNHIVFPKKLQPLAADCPEFTFGTFRVSDLAAKSSPLASNSLENNSKQQDSGAIYGPSVQFLEKRNSGHLNKNFHDEQLGFMPDSRGLTTNIINRDIPMSSGARLIRHSIPNVAHGHGYTSPLSLPHYNVKNKWEPSSSWPLLKNPVAMNAPSLPRELQASSTTLPVIPLASELKSTWEPRLAYPSFGAQSAPSRDSSVISAIGGPTISMSEMLNSSSHASLLSHAPALSGAGLAKGPVLPQHQLVQSYPQHDLSLEELVKLNNSLAYTRDPSALQQSYRDSRTLHESLAGVKGNFPWFRGSVPRSSLPLSDSISSYGGLGGSTDFHRGFRHNFPSHPTGTTADYNHNLLSHYKEANFNSMLQQKNDGSSAWNYGPHSRRMSTVPDNLSSPAENQVLSRHQPGQRLPQSMRYTTGFHSPTQTIEDQQRQSDGDFTFSSLQGPSNNQLNRRWPWSS